MSQVKSTSIMPVLQRLDDYDLHQFTHVASTFGSDRFGYVVTPNVDHLIRYHDDAAFRADYADASYVLLDSKFLSHLLRLTKGIRVPVCTGSDLTASLLNGVIRSDDAVILIGSSPEQAAQLTKRYRLSNLKHYNPPMGFIKDDAAVEACLQFIEANSPFRFCFLAVGSPQQEKLAQKLKMRGIALGLALCTGAAIDFLTGQQTRAPLWMQQLGSEWLYRLMRDPRRMANRYLVRGPRIFGMLRGTHFQLRRAAPEKDIAMSLRRPVEKDLGLQLRRVMEKEAAVQSRRAADKDAPIELHSVPEKVA